MTGVPCVTSLLLFPVPLAAVDGGMWLLGGAVGTVPTWAPGALGTFRGGRTGLCGEEPVMLAGVWHRDRQV